MKAIRDRFIKKIRRLPFVCPLFHKRHWTWTITGGFKTQYCSKCDMSWVTRVDNVV